MAQPFSQTDLDLMDQVWSDLSSRTPANENDSFIQRSALRPNPVPPPMESAGAVEPGIPLRPLGLGADEVAALGDRTYPDPQRQPQRGPVWRPGPIENFMPRRQFVSDQPTALAEPPTDVYGKPITSENPFEAEYQNILKREREAEFKDRGFLGGVASDVVGGLVDYGELGLRGIRTLVPKGSALEEAATAGIERINRFKEETPFLQQDPNAGYLSRSFHGGIRSATQSVAAGLPTAAAGAAMGSVLGPAGTAIGAVLGFAFGGATQFGLAQYDDVMERGKPLVDQGKLSYGDLQASAIRQGLYEGGFEFASDLLGGWLMGAGKLLTAPAKEAAQLAIRDMFKVSFKDFAKRAAGLTAAETSTEMVTSGLQALEDKRLGLGNQTFWEGAAEAFGPSVVASMIFAGLGHANVKYAQSKLAKTLENPDAKSEHRLGAVREVYETLKQYDQTVADAWVKSAYQVVAQGKPISTREDVLAKEPEVEPKPLLALPPGQGFIMREPGEVYAPYSPEYAEVRKVAEERGLPAPAPQEPEQEQPELTIEQLDTRIKNLSKTEKSITTQLGKATTDERRAKLSQRLTDLQAQIQANKDQRDVLLERTRQEAVDQQREVDRQRKILSELPDQPLPTDLADLELERQYLESVRRSSPAGDNLVDLEAVAKREQQILAGIDAEEIYRQRFERTKLLDRRIGNLEKMPNPSEKQQQNLESFKQERTELQDYEDQAAALGIRFIGMQEQATSKPSIPLFNDNNGATFTIMEGESLEDALKRKRGDFTVKKEETSEAIDKAANEAATSPKNELPEPTQAQKEAGNYKLGHVDFQGLDISIENPRGSIRKGVSPEGKPWETELTHHYGYLKGTVGKDKDHVDIFIGPEVESDRVFVVDQVDPKTGKFDEHKVMLGFQNQDVARQGYLSNYEEGWKGLGAMTEMSMDEFKAWAKSDKTKKPVADLGKEAESDRQGEGGLAGPLREGEEPGGTIQEPGPGGEKTRPGGMVQKPEGGEGEVIPSPEGITIETPETPKTPEISRPSEGKFQVGSSVKWTDRKGIEHTGIVQQWFRNTANIKDEGGKIYAVKRDKLTAAIAEPTGPIAPKEPEKPVDVSIEPVTKTQEQGVEPVSISPKEPEKTVPPKIKTTKETSGVWKDGYRATVTEGEHKDVVGFAWTPEGAVKEAEKAIRERERIKEREAETVAIETPEKPTPTEEQAEPKGAADQIQEMSMDELDIILDEGEKAAQEKEQPIIEPETVEEQKPAFKLGDQVEYKGERWEIGFINNSATGYAGSLRLQKSGAADVVFINYIDPRDVTLIAEEETAPEQEPPAEITIEPTPAGGPRAPKGPRQPRPKRTASEIAKSAAEHGVKGIDEAISGLYELFGGKAIRSFPGGIDEDTYQKAKPHFQKALEEFQAAGKDVKAFVKWAYDSFSSKIKPYLRRFIQELKGIKPESPEVETEEGAGEGITIETEGEEGTGKKKRTKKLLDTGEKLGGKRSSKDHRERSEAIEIELDGDTSEVPPKTMAEFLIDKTTRSKYLKVDHAVEGRTPGTGRFLDIFRSLIATWPDAYKGEMGVSRRRRGRNVVEILERHLSGGWVLNEEEAAKNQAHAKKSAAEYISTLEQLNDAVSSAVTVGEARQNIMKLLVGEEQADKWLIEEDQEQVRTTFGTAMNMSYLPDEESILTDTGKSLSKFLGKKWDFGHFMITGWQPTAETELAEDKNKPIVRQRRNIFEITTPDTYRNGRDVTPEELLETFALRGLDFGEWVEADFRQRSVNLTYDSFKMLAESLGANDKGISLNDAMRLGIGWGARGRGGRTAAEFYPDNKVIALTKTKGDGSLAHEWAHAFDFMTERDNFWADAQGNYVNAINDIKLALGTFYNTADLENLVMDLLRGVWSQARSRTGRLQEAKKFLKDEAIDHPARQTRFESDAIMLDGGKRGKYYSKKEEMFARAFEAYVSDKLQGSNTYLVDAAFVAPGAVEIMFNRENGAYPSEKERERFNQIFDEFFSQIEWSESGIPKVKPDYVPVTTLERRRAQEAIDAMMERIDKIYEALYGGEQSEDGLYWYAFEQTGRGVAAQPKGYIAYDDSYDLQKELEATGASSEGVAGKGAVAYTDQLKADEVLMYFLRPIQYNEADTKITLEVPDGTNGLWGIRGPEALEEAPPENVRPPGEAGAPGAGSPGRPGEIGGGDSGPAAGGGPDRTGEGDDNAEIDLSPVGGGGTDLASGSDAFQPTVRIDYTIRANSGLEQTNQTERFNNNIAAIRTLKQIESEGRLATAEEQAILVKYSGWGELSEALSRYPSDTWKGRSEIVASVLSEDEIQAIRRSSLDAYYTAPTVAHNIHEGLQRLGFSGGKVLEPSCGVGHFFGTMPETIRRNSTLTGVDIDGISARITGQLYQNANILHQPFEETQIPDNFYDLTISNVPFGDNTPYDKKHNPKHWPIHDYFINKMIAITKPGGLIVAITSTGTMDKHSQDARKQYAEEVDLLGAIRLPNGIFPGALAGADILYFRKKGEGLAPVPDLGDWVGTTVKKMPAVNNNGTAKGYDDEVKINNFFLGNSDRVIGSMAVGYNQYGGPRVQVTRRDDFAEKLTEAIDKLPTSIYSTVFIPTEIDILDMIPEESDLKDFNYYVGDDGKIYQAQAGNPKLIDDLTPDQTDKIKRLIGMRGIIRTLLRAQAADKPAKELDALRKKLRERYDAFVTRYGAINLRANHGLLKWDPDAGLLFSLENWDRDTKTVKSLADIFTKNTVAKVTPPTSAETAEESLVYSLMWRGRVDLPYMSTLTGKTQDTLINELKGKIFDDPEKGYVTSDEYLSGNVRKKLVTARAATQLDPKYQENVEALEIALPVDLEMEDIRARLGSAWVPADVVTRFVLDLFGGRLNGFHLDHVVQTGLWSPHFRGRTKAQAKRNEQFAREHSVASNEYGVTDDRGRNRINLFNVGNEKGLLYFALNGGFPKIMDTVRDPDGRTREVLNIQLTDAANAKVDALQARFSAWIHESEEVSKELKDIYNKRFNSFVERQYDGSHLTFPGKVPDEIIKLRSHQKNAIWRFLQSGVTYLAHEVGTGKTFTMIGSIMEAKRMGLARKAVMATKKANMEQIAADFLTLYPGANVLVMKIPENAEKRKRVFARIATGNYDCIIVNHDSFKKIPLSPETQREIINREVENYERALEEAVMANAARHTVRDIQKRINKLRTKLRELADMERDDVPTFEEMGLDMVVVDESHTHKNIGFQTKYGSIKGVEADGSDIAFDLFMKTQYLHARNGRGVLFASGTPLTNSVGELFNISRYLHPRELERFGIATFDAWANTFGVMKKEAEYSPEGGGFKLTSRFAEFMNIPELMALMRQQMDIRTAEDLGIPRPDLIGGKPVAIDLGQNEFTQAFQQVLKERVRNYRADPKNVMYRGVRDNMLRIVNDGRLVAMDPRLYDPSAQDYAETKSNVCVDKVWELYRKPVEAIDLDRGSKTYGKPYKEKNHLQLIFADRGVPGGRGFNLYADIKKKLTAKGIPADKIAFAHDYKTDDAKAELYKKARAGEIRVLLGSTGLMGIGVNVQDRVSFLHHLDVDWTYANYEQRNGRGWRFGNRVKDIGIFNYGVKKTVDAFMWSTVAYKEKILQQVMSNDPKVRSVQDVSKTSVEASEMEALLSDDPLHKEKIELDAEVRRLGNIKSDYEVSRRRAREKLARAPLEIQAADKAVANNHLHLHIAEAITAFEVGNVPGLIPRDQGAFFDLEKEGGRANEAVAGILKKIKFANENQVAMLGRFGKIVSEEVTVREKDAKTGKEVEKKKTVKRFYPLSGSLYGKDKGGLIFHIGKDVKHDSSLEHGIKRGLTTIQNGLKANIKEKLAIARSLREEVPKLEKLVATPWDKEIELAEKERRLREVTETLLRRQDEEDARARAELGQQQAEAQGEIVLDTEEEEGASEPSFSIANTKPWPANFPKAYAQTHPGKVSNHPDHEAAKAGDVDAAIRLVNDLVKPERMEELGRRYPGAKLVAVHAEEATGKNAIPKTYAEALGSHTGLEVVTGIVQTNLTGHTKKNALERMLSRAIFDGPVIQGQDYIIVDDLLTQGGTVSELRHYLENKGGRVVAVTSLGFSTGSNVVAVKPENVIRLVNKFGRNQLENVLKENDIAGSIEALTNSEALYLLSYSNLDTIRDRIAQTKREGSERQGFSLFQKTERRKTGQVGLDRQAVESSLAPLISKWTNAPAGGVRVVQSQKELPSRIVERARGKEIEGVYDPRTGSVWLVADNLPSLERAEEVFAHEVYGHFGLEAFLGKRKADSFLAEVAMLYGKEGLKAIAEQHGFDLSTKEGRLKAAEEKLARMAENRERPGLLKRIYAAIRAALREAGFKFKLDDADIQRMLTRSRKWVEGGQARQGVAETQPLSFSTKLIGQQERFAESIDRFLEGKLKPGSVVTVSDTPEVLLKLGAKQLPIVIDPKTLKKIISSREERGGKHGISAELIKQIPKQLIDPIMVFDSATQPNSLVVMTELQHQGKTVVVAIRLSKELPDRHLVNDVSSIHPRERDNHFSNWIKQGLLRYVNEEKSRDWFVTRGLQLPRARGTIHGIDNTVLTEKDLVKFQATTENDPDILFSLSARDLLDKLQSKLEGTPKSAIDVVFGRQTDLGELAASFGLPAWLGKNNATVRGFQDRQDQRDKDRSKIIHDYLKNTESLYNLSGKDQVKFDKLAFELDGKKVVDLPKFKKTGTRQLIKGPKREIIEVPVYELNEAHYKALDEHLKKEKKVPDAIRTAYLNARKALDRSLIQTYERLQEIKKLDPNLIEEYRNAMGQIDNYWPHVREGNYHIRVVDPKADVKTEEPVKYREDFNAAGERHARFWYAKNIDRIAAEIKKDNPGIDLKSLEWTVERNKDMPEEVYDFPIAIDAMQMVADAAVDKMPEEAGIKEQLRKEFSQEISNVLKSRGHGAHFVKRRNIPGYQKTNAAKVLYNHFAGFSGWLTKMEAAHDYGDMLREIQAREHPGEYRWAVRYVHDMLQNQTRIDRVVDNAKAFFFMKYLGLGIKTMAVNLTQNPVVGIPRLSMDIGIAGAGRQFAKAVRDIRLDITEKRIEGSKGGRLSADEKRLLGDMFAEGWGQSQFLNEIRGKVGGKTGKVFGKVARVMGYSMEVSEKYNRLSLGLAAFRAAREGTITNQKTLDAINLKQGEKASYEAAKGFAEEVVKDSHFVFGKGNRPQFMRGTSGGKALSAVFTFRIFSYNQLSLWRWMLASGDKEGKKAFAYSLLAMIMLGGLSAIPLYNSLASLIREIFGEDLLGNGVRKQFPPGMRDLVMYGGPSLVGVNIGGSIGMELPVIDRLNVNKSISGQLGEGIGSLLGVPYSMFDELTKAVDALKSGRPDRAAETVAPNFLKNIMSAERLYREGQTTVTGKPINVPGEKFPRKLTEGEAVGKALGFQPVSSTKAFEIYKSLEQLKSYRDEKQSELANRYVAAMRQNDQKEMVAVRNEAREWNRAAVVEGRREMRIDLQAAIRARQKARQPMKQMRGLAKEYRESYGM